MNLCLLRPSVGRFDRLHVLIDVVRLQQRDILETERADRPSLRIQQIRVHLSPRTLAVLFAWLPELLNVHFLQHVSELNLFGGVVLQRKVDNATNFLPSLR